MTEPNTTETITDDTPETEQTEPDGVVANDTEPDTFPRAYVEQLRSEAADHRTRAKDRDEIAQRLHAALTAATGRLQDATDLPFDEAHLSDPDALGAAIDALLDAKPHLASRTPSGDVGQGAVRSDEPVDLAAILRANAG